ncbi:unnamed protein product, partial [Cyprideis torosa]
MGIIAVGIFCMNTQALTGTLYQIVAHATSTGMLFLFVGLMEQRTGSRQIEDLGGIAHRAPIFATFFAIAMLASCGLPGTSGFVGEFLIILGAVRFNLFVGFLACLTLLLGVCYMLPLFQKVFFEKPKQLTASFRDLTVYETLVFLPVILLILVMGIAPQPFLAKIEPAAKKQILQLKGFARVEYYCLLAFATAGMLFLTMARELILAFVALEVMSLSVYVMVGMRREQVRAVEAVLKYLVLGAFS